MIKSIRITRDQFAPEVHYAGEFRIEILTQPGIGPVRGNMRIGLLRQRDRRQESAGRRSAARRRACMYGVGLNGTLISQRASFNVNFNGTDSYSTPVQVAATSIGQVARQRAVPQSAGQRLLLRRRGLRAQPRSGPAPQFQRLAIHQGEHGVGNFDLDRTRLLG